MPVCRDLSCTSQISKNSQNTATPLRAYCLLHRRANFGRSHLDHCDALLRHGKCPAAYLRDVLARLPNQIDLDTLPSSLATGLLPICVVEVASTTQPRLLQQSRRHSAARLRELTDHLLLTQIHKHRHDPLWLLPFLSLRGTRMDAYAHAARRGLHSTGPEEC